MSYTSQTIIPSYIYYAELPKDNENEEIEVEYQIQQILDHRVKEKEIEQKQAVQTIEREQSLAQAKEEDIEYLVKWIGYEQLTWEPASNLKNAPDVVQHYRQENIHNSNMIGRKTKAEGKKGKKKEATKNPAKKDLNRGIRTPNPKNFDISKVFPKAHIKTEFEDNEDELMIINKETYKEAVEQNKLKAEMNVQDQGEEKDKEGICLFDNLFTFLMDSKDQQRDQGDKLEAIEQLQEPNNQITFKENNNRQIFFDDQNDENNKMPSDYCNEYQNPLSYTSNHNSPQENNQPRKISAQSPEEHSDIKTMSKDISIIPLAPLEYIENIESHDHHLEVQTKERKECKKRSKKIVEPDLQRYDSVCKISKLNEFIDSKSMKGKQKKKEIPIIEIQSDSENKIGSYLI